MEDAAEQSIEQEDAPCASRLGEILIHHGVIIKDQLVVALNKQDVTGHRLGETLLKLNYVTEEQMRRALCLQLHIPFLDLDKCVTDRRLAKVINKSYAKRNQVVPIGKRDGAITLAMDDPTNVAVIQELQGATGCRIEAVTSSSAALQRAFTRVYEDDFIDEAEFGSDGELLTGKDEDGPEQSQYVADYYQNKAVDDLVRRVITLAIHHRASDIHLENLGRRVRTRFRIDGALQELNLGFLEESISQNRLPIISRIKILAKLDIAERRRPQDGSFRARLEKDGEVISIDFRVSIIPGYTGENVVLRILDPRNAPQGIEQVGFSPQVVETLRQLLQRTSGIMLIVGPTGSGKSTTLYGALRTLYRPEIRIITVEDPVEYVYENFSQCEVNEKIGNTFARYLRGILRHDPEVIMVGEIRDAETAQIAFRAAQTGHLVLSTLHTNSAVGTATRLLDLGIDPSRITSSLLGVVSQRLIRQLCTACKTPYEPSSDLLHEFFDAPPDHLEWYTGRGCAECNFTGYKGRMAVAEVWVPNEKDIVLLSKGASFDELLASSRVSTLLMVDDVMRILDQGRTDLEELIRTLPYATIEQFRQFGKRLA